MNKQKMNAYNKIIDFLYKKNNFSKINHKKIKENINALFKGQNVIIERLMNGIHWSTNKPTCYFKKFNEIYKGLKTHFLNSTKYNAISKTIAYAEIMTRLHNMFMEKRKQAQERKLREKLQQRGQYVWSTIKDHFPRVQFK